MEYKKKLSILHEICQKLMIPLEFCNERLNTDDQPLKHEESFKSKVTCGKISKLATGSSIQLAKESAAKEMLLHVRNLLGCDEIDVFKSSSNKEICPYSQLNSLIRELNKTKDQNGSYSEVFHELETLVSFRYLFIIKYDNFEGKGLSNIKKSAKIAAAIDLISKLRDFISKSDK